MEERFAHAHRQSVQGEISFDELRSLVNAVAVSHPVIIETVDKWLISLPESPYASTIRSVQLSNTAWGLRGGLALRQTPRDAVIVFGQMQDRAMDHAVRAYTHAPDFVPATDMVLSLQQVTDYFPRSEFFGILKQVMVSTPNLGTLSRAGAFSIKGWGGRGQEDIAFICEEHAHRMDDPSFDLDICRQFVSIGVASVAEQAEGWRRLEGRHHPSLNYLRARFLSNTFDRVATDEEREIVEAFLENEGRTNLTVAENYYLSFGLAPRRDEILSAVVQAAIADARERLVHDPYNIALLDIVLERGILYSTVRSNDEFAYQNPNEETLLARYAVARPFHAESWLEVARGAQYALVDAKLNTAMPYFQNALFYSDHDIHVVEETLFHAMTLLAYDHYARNPGNADVAVTSDTTEELVCQFVRLDRIATHVCRGLGVGAELCPEIKQFEPNYDLYVRQAAETGFCEAESNASFADLKYEPTQILLEELSRPVNWD